jgi:AhpD family alkylhydroperoxidase
MEKRIDIQEIEPKAYKAMYALEGYLATTEISKTHKDLIKIRASQINGCAFCIDMHTKDALKNGETNQRIFLLNAWKETGILYGSRAKGTFKPASDIDLTLTGPDLDLTILQILETELDDLLLPYKIDLSIFHKITNPDLVEHITRVGKTVYSKTAQKAA